ncbi:PREDICTED: uncharacterized protein LOC108563966 [Nicrophorus vespilloides]|uniref:Uncharacterized protein LOC108563966 n=1 Tax=Nicrophorus vespilloides TaxID=110193 RepID=A0ABM1MUQ1_NICVS|nr:PREDICTED: uncharacterized protein LOC108563966 [Nicrophorus vespilloides]
MYTSTMDISTKKRRSLSFQTKVEILKLADQGQTTSEIATLYGLNRSTISTILKDKIKILDHVISSGSVDSYIVSKKRGSVIEEMERLLKLWISECSKTNEKLSMEKVQSKALSLYEELKIKRGEHAGDVLPFLASSGWYYRFRARTKITGFSHVQTDRTTQENTVDDLIKLKNSSTIVTKNKRRRKTNEVKAPANLPVVKDEFYYFALDIAAKLRQHSYDTASKLKQNIEELIDKHKGKIRRSRVINTNIEPENGEFGTWQFVKCEMNEADDCDYDESEFVTMKCESPDEIGAIEEDDKTMEECDVNLEPSIKVEIISD